MKEERTKSMKGERKRGKGSPKEGKIPKPWKQKEKQMSRGEGGTVLSVLSCLWIAESFSILVAVILSLCPEHLVLLT